MIIYNMYNIIDLIDLVLLRLNSLINQLNFFIHDRLLQKFSKDSK